MESNAKAFGHPIHPILIVFPLGLLATSLGFDIGYLTTGNPEFAVVSFWLISIGILGGFLAAIPGAIDWWVIPSQTRAKAIGLWHGGGNIIVLLLFIASYWFRSQHFGYAPSATAVTLSCVAVLIALITGWLGGELVDRLGVGVDNGAHLNAPNSLSGKPATYNTAAPEISGHKRGRQ
jgi:uncharacterized membrane protein